jgi:hypothetical protein
MALVDARAYYEYVKVTKCDISPRSVQRFRNV